MSKIKLLVIAVFALIVLNLGLIGTFLMIGDRHLKPSHPKERMIPRITNHLNFDDAQEEQFHLLVRDHHNLVEKAEQQIKEVKKELYQSLVTGNEEKNDSLLNRLGVLQAQIESLHFDHFKDIKKLCKEDQLDDFKELSKRLTETMRNRENRMPPPPKRHRN